MHHGDARTSQSGDRALAEAVLSGEWEESPQQLQTLLRYAVKLTREPWTMSRADIDGLRSVGLDDRAIVDTNQVVSYLNHVNRVADGLGVELEDDRR